MLSAPVIRFTEDDKLIAYSEKKFLFFEPGGLQIREMKTNIVGIIEDAKYLSNGNYLFRILSVSEEGNQFKIIVLFCRLMAKIPG